MSRSHSLAPENTLMVIRKIERDGVYAQSTNKVDDVYKKLSFKASGADRKSSCATKCLTAPFIPGSSVKERCLWPLLHDSNCTTRAFTLTLTWHMRGDLSWRFTRNRLGFT